jgi:TonB-dependent receptor
MKAKKALLFLCALCASVVNLPAASISGVVSNKATGLFLEDAFVEIRPKNLRLRTDALGRFKADALEPGTYFLTASYTDLDPLDATVTLASNDSSAVQNFPLTSEVYALDEFVVTGEREGNAASLARQQAADNVKTVISLDALGFLVNDNPADLLIRLPGITGNIDDDGNIASINVRGIDPSLNIVTYDGAQMSTSYGLGSRAFRFYNINASTFEELEVIKALTPDMNPASLGGTVNMKTKTTLNMKEKRLFTYRLAFRHNPSFLDYNPRRSGETYPSLALGYKEVFSVLGGKRNLGLSLDLSHNVNPTGNSFTRLNWEYTLASPAYASNFRASDSIGWRKLDSATLRLDFKLSSNSRLWASFLYSQSDELPGSRDGTFLTILDLTRNQNAFLDYTNDYTQFKNGTLTLQQSFMGFLDRTWRANFGGEHNLRHLSLDYDLTCSDTHVDLNPDPSKIYSGKQVRSIIGRNSTYGVGGIFDYSNGLDFPLFTQTSGPDIYNVNSYVANYTRLEQRDGTRDNNLLEARLNAKSFLHAAGHPLELKAGLAFRRQFYDEKASFTSWQFNPANPSSGASGDLSNFLTNIPIDPRFHDSITALPRLDITAVAMDKILNPQNWSRNDTLIIDDEFDNRAGTYNLTEKILSGYLMARTRLLSGKLGVLAGARYEITDYKGDAWKRRVSNFTRTGETPEEYLNILFGEKQVHVASNYDNLFPGIHFTYSFNKSLLARLSYSTGIGRPLPKDLLPIISINDTDYEIRASPSAVTDASGHSGELIPQYAHNYDLSLEYYFKHAGAFTFGLFRKDIRDFIYQSVSQIGDGPDNGFSGSWAGYDLFIKHNGARATIDGIELSYNQNLDFPGLPRLLRGFNINLNYTRIKTKGDYGIVSTDPYSPHVMATSEVAGFKPETANARLRYTHKKFSAYIAWNYTCAFLSTYSDQPGGLIYCQSRSTTDAGLGWKFSNYFQAQLSVSNLFDAPLRYYQADKSRRYQTSYQGPSVTLSLTGRL